MAINKELWTRCNESYDGLPAKVKEDIKEVCKVYDRAFVTFYNGDYHVSSGYGICSHYPADHRSVGCYFAEDIYTEEERIINYMEVFHEYHPRYKGRRDYGMLRDIKRNWDVRFNLDDAGNLVINSNTL